jgi:hypothetical protein
MPPNFQPFHERSDSDAWPEIEPSLIEDGRASVPAFPLDVLPQPWRDWVADTARSAGAPADYVALAVLGAVAGLCGGAAVRVTPSWVEPLALRQALVGGPSSGKSPALAPVRGLLATIEADGPPAPATGQFLWHDDSPDWFGALGPDVLEAWADKPTPSVLGTIGPDLLEQTLREIDVRLAARFLYAWPELPPYCPLAEHQPVRDAEALAMLQRVARKARLSGDPLVLQFDAHGVKAFDGFLAGLHAQMREAEGLQAGWLGKGAGTVARLAGALELLAWSGLDAPGLPGHIGSDRVEAAAGLWSNYFRPHASAVFDRAAPRDLELQARRVARWLKAGAETEVSRDDIRRHALGRTVNSGRTNVVIGRLVSAGALRPASHAVSPQGGRPALRWQVNPALTAAQ